MKERKNQWEKNSSPEERGRGERKGKVPTLRRPLTEESTEERDFGGECSNQSVEGRIEYDLCTRSVLLSVHLNLSCESPGTERVWVLKSGPWRLNLGRGHQLLCRGILKGREWGLHSWKNLQRRPGHHRRKMPFFSDTQGRTTIANSFPFPEASASKLDTHLSRFLPPQAKA